MKRLRDELDSSDPLLARAADVVRSAPSIEPSGFRQKQIKSELLAVPKPTRAAWILRPAGVLTVLIGTIGIASAMLGRSWVERRFAPPGRVLDAADPEPAPTAISRVIAPSLRIPKVTDAGQRQRAMLIAVPTPVAATPQRSTGPVAEAEREPAQASPPQPPTVTQKSQPPLVEEAALLVRATRALRREHDAGQSETLLAEYFRRFPAGTLAEEALALAIEVAAYEESPRATLLAARYLERYPNGRFRQTAERVQRRFQK